VPARKAKTRHRANEAHAAPLPFFERAAAAVTHFTGSTAAFLGAVAFVLLWAASGPFLGFSERWQLIVNTVTTIVTFLMVFVIQRAQNKESLAVQLKLNEIVAAIEGASNRLINVESLGEEELATLHEHYERLVQLARQEQHVAQSHSVEEAEARHGEKTRRRGTGSRRQG
jgi:low affinity Fe/Cu permease